LCSWQRGFGTYDQPLTDPERNLSMLAEVEYTMPEEGRLKGWSLKGGLGMDRGSLLGDNMGLQLTVRKRMSVK
jgi:hypothetical protein